jgi:hypothetical protein
MPTVLCYVLCLTFVSGFEFHSLRKFLYDPHVYCIMIVFPSLVSTMVSVGTMKQTVTLLKQVKLDGVWKRYPVVLNRNGSIKPDHVLVAKD